MTNMVLSVIRMRLFPRSEAEGERRCPSAYLRRIWAQAAPATAQRRARRGLEQRRAGPRYRARHHPRRALRHRELTLDRALRDWIAAA
jgi:hypothetical protein